MLYGEFCGNKISRLGMGNMRLPVKGGPDGDIDTEAAQEIIDEAYENGINYFDTAYMYHNGESERFIGEALKKYPRDSFYLADKMPGFMVKPGLSAEDIFEDQLKKCQVDYFDFYLLHNVNEEDIDIYMDEKLGIVDYLLEQKRKGRIRYLGFSSHGKPDTLRRFLEWRDCFEFVQIQLNYLDWDMQDAKTQYDIITEHGLKIWVMEPCRGGRLASLCPEADEMLRKARPDLSVASWAFRYVLSLPEVQVVLSGMTQPDQLRDNLKTFSAGEPLSPAEKTVLKKAIRVFKKSFGVPCTKCRYCNICPMGIEIPELLAIYNSYKLSPSPSIVKELEDLDLGMPDECIGCGGCVSRCPQGINTPEIMREMAGIVEEYRQMASGMPE